MMKTYSKMIDDYIRGTLSPSEMLNFEKALEKSPHLQIKVKICKELHDSSDESDILALRTKLSIAHSSSIIAQKRLKKILYSSAAACVAIIIAVSIIIISGKPMHEVLFADHFDAYQPIGETRSSGIENNNSVSTIANLYYGKKQYDTAIAELTIYLNNNPNEVQAKLLLASVHLEANNAPLAETILEELLNSNPEAHIEEIGKWYLALSILKQGRVDDVKQILIEIEKKNGFYAARARSILNSL